MKKEPTYQEQVWKYLVREWTDDGLKIIPNGQTDNEEIAVQKCMAHPRYCHVLKVLTNEIIFSNHGYY